MSLKEKIKGVWNQRCIKFTRKLLYGLMYYPLLINSAAIPTIYVANQSIVPKTKTVVFTSGRHEGETYWIIAKGIDYAMYVPVTLKQILEGNRVEWYSNATKETVLERITDPAYENIVVIGHGGNNYYCASDKTVYASAVRERKIKKKSGRLIQYTCGDKGVKYLSEALMKNPSKSFSFNATIGPERIYWRVLRDLFNE